MSVPSMSGLTVNEGREAMDCSHKFAGLRIRTVLFKGSLEPTTDFQVQGCDPRQR